MRPQNAQSVALFGQTVRRAQHAEISTLHDAAHSNVQVAVGKRVRSGVDGAPFQGGALSAVERGPIRRSQRYVFAHDVASSAAETPLKSDTWNREGLHVERLDDHVKPVHRGQDDGRVVHEAILQREKAHYPFWIFPGSETTAIFM